jgi:hypothetical protein
MSKEFRAEPRMALGNPPTDIPEANDTDNEIFDIVGCSVGSNSRAHSPASVVGVK